MVTLAARGGAAFEGGAGRANRRIAVGIALSLVVHALVLNMGRSQSRRDGEEAPRSIAVRLRPPPPPAPRVEEPAPVRPAARPARSAQGAAARPVIAVDPAPQPAQPDPFTVQQAPEPADEPDTPRFDREAARKMARSLADIRDPAKEGTAIGQFPDKPLETETRAARAIGAAKRRNCKDGVPGGLFAPLLMLADKKDSGCKW
ncbi:hypothetical protein ACHAC9_15625 [Massilia sp. CMS3.1]|uniref:hypothetical protein n=1 Tax=Massilia sp. CMS3.1 TaxID=3373083 RepID=UPI003EE8164C